MRKQRKQPAFAGLTEIEIDQIARWLHSNTYDVVRDHIAKPRPEGFGLIVSNSALQRLFAKSAARILQDRIFSLKVERFGGNVLKAAFTRE